MAFFYLSKLNRILSVSIALLVIVVARQRPIIFQTFSPRRQFGLNRTQREMGRQKVFPNIPTKYGTLWTKWMHEWFYLSVLLEIVSQKFLFQQKTLISSFLCSKIMAVLLLHTASRWTFTQKKINGNFEHSPRNYMPSGSQNRYWINHWRPSEREIAKWSSILFCDTSIFQLNIMDTKKFII